jgi:RNA polymerase sigma-70 factor (ECF subfamily)
VGTRDSTEVEATLALLHQQGDLEALSSRAIETYSAEVGGYLHRVLGSESLALDTLQDTCEGLIRALPSFRGESSFRTLFYVIAKRAARRARAASRDAVPLSRAPEPADKSRTATAPYLRTDVKDAFRELRAALSEEEQALLVLRVDRGMDWRDIARVLAEDETLDDAKEAARRRKQFQRAKARLRRMAVAEGLIADGG